MTAPPRPDGTPPQGGDPPRGDARASATWAPLRGGTFAGTVLLLALCALAAYLEGGATPDDRRTNAYAQALVLLIAAGVLGFYARRILLCAYEDDRPVPWFRDERDARPWTADVGAFVTVVFLTFVPLVVWTVVQRAADPPKWAGVAATAGSLAYATFVFPFAHAAAVLRGSVLAATPIAALRALRANASAARRAISPAFLFLALFAVSAALSGAFNPSPEDGRTMDDHSTGRMILRAFVFLARSAAVWAALVSFRAAGLLAREVPEVGEVLR